MNMGYLLVISIFILFYLDHAHSQNTSWASSDKSSASTIDSDSCLDRYDCQDKLMNCIGGLCQCPPGYLVNPEDMYCLKPSTTYQDYCSSDSTCTVKLGEECMRSRCQCQRNYKYSEAVKRCLYFKCQESGDCQPYDENRECRNEICMCKDGYYDPISAHLCIKKSETHEKSCFSQYDCYEANQRCVDNLCQCEPDYTFNSDRQSCETYNCESYPENCGHSYDIHRHCDNWKNNCVCDEDYTPDASNGNKCTFTSQSTTSTETDLTWLYITIGIVIILGLITGFANAIRHSPRTSSRRVERMNRTVQVDCGTSNRAMHDVGNFYSVNVDAPRTPPPPYSP